MKPTSLPLSKRAVDIALIVFFIINLFFVTYIVDLEQLVISNADHFQYPRWPPARLVDHFSAGCFVPHVEIHRSLPAW